jgi:hypothetical protein
MTPSQPRRTATHAIGLAHTIPALRTRRILVTGRHPQRGQHPDERDRLLPTLHQRRIRLHPGNRGHLHPVTVHGRGHGVQVMHLRTAVVSRANSCGSK